MKISDVMKQYRWATKIGLRELAGEIGFSPSTLSRLESGEVPSGSNLGKLLCWLLQGSDGSNSTPPVGEEKQE